MAASDRQTPPFFKRGLPPAARLTIYLLLSFTLLVADLRLRYLDTLRLGVSVLTYPLQIAAATPSEFVRNASDYFAGLISLKQENSRLKAQQLEATSQLLLNEQLRNDNDELRGLLGMSARVGVKATAAEIVFTARDPFSRKVILDKGSQQGIDPGTPVVDPLGVIGQVTRVFPLHSEVTLLSDKDQAIPVLIERSGLRAVMFGTGNGLMELRFLAANADIRPGDRIVTSGLDGVFVAGLPVAAVLKVSRDSAESFARILCRPLGVVERSGAVLVLARAKPVLDRPPEEYEGDARRSSVGRIRPFVAEPAASAAVETAPVAHSEGKP
jgi:rod shape-determining protein MreC